MAVDTPTGMGAADEDNLVFHRGHPHIEEQNDPIAYGARPVESFDPIAHYQWRQDRSDANAATGNPIVPDPGADPGLRGADV